MAPSAGPSRRRGARGCSWFGEYTPLIKRRHSGRLGIGGTPPLDVGGIGERLRLTAEATGVIRRFSGAPGIAESAACVTLTVRPATVSVAVRDVVPVFAAIVNAVVPDPGPEPVSVIQLTLSVADHAHPVCVVTAMVPLSPSGAPVRVRGLTVNVQAAAASLTVNVLPAIVSVAARVDVAVSAAAVYPTVPLPLPLSPLVIVTQPAPLEAVQLHPAAAVTVTEPVPPAAVCDRLVGEIVYEHGAACVTV